MMPSDETERFLSRSPFDKMANDPNTLSEFNVAMMMSVRILRRALINSGVPEAVIKANAQQSQVQLRFGMGMPFAADVVEAIFSDPDHEPASEVQEPAN